MLEFERELFHVSIDSQWIHVLLYKMLEIEYLYTQNDERVNEKLTLNSTPMKLEKLEKGNE